MRLFSRIFCQIVSVSFLYLIVPGLVQAADVHPTAWQASQHCDAVMAASLAAVPGRVGRCLYSETTGNMQVSYQGQWMGAGIPDWQNISDAQGQGTQGHFGPVVDCSAEPDVTRWVSAVMPGFIIAPVSTCIGNSGCDFRYDAAAQDPNPVCNYTDSDLSGSPSDGDPYSCPKVYNSSEFKCDWGALGNATDAASPDSSDCSTNCTSSSPPAPSNSSGGGGVLPGDDPANPNDPGNLPGAGAGDGNPDTPGGPGSGTGSGDTDGDGNRDIDCNPQSNPDCQFTSSATGQGDCSVQPQCTGEPVGCALLFQQWATMCFDGASFNNPSSCTAAFTCDGDVIGCELIRQQRQQYCDSFVGNGTVDLDVFNDADFNRDLKNEGEVIVLPTMIAQTGFAGSGACPAPLDFTAFGQSFNISLNPICQLAPFIRILVILSALISAAFIVTGTKK